MYQFWKLIKLYFCLASTHNCAVSRKLRCHAHCAAVLCLFQTVLLCCMLSCLARFNQQSAGRQPCQALGVVITLSFSTLSGLLTDELCCFKKNLWCWGGTSAGKYYSPRNKLVILRGGGKSAEKTFEFKKFLFQNLVILRGWRTSAEKYKSP